MDTFKTITVRQYQALYTISQTADDDKDIKLVSVLTGLTLTQVEDMRLDDYNAVCRAISHIFSVKPEARPKRRVRILGKRFRIIYNPRQLTPGKYVEIQTWLKAGTIDNMDKIFASMVERINWLGWKIKDKKDRSGTVIKSANPPHPELSEAIKDLKFIHIHSACVFFSLLWKNSIKGLEDYLVSKAPMMEREKLRKLLQTASGGFSMQSQ